MLALIIQRIRKHRAWILALSAVVVFCTTYALILPALTLEQEEAAQQGGIDLPKTEQSADKQDAAVSGDPQSKDAEKKDVKAKEPSDSAKAENPNPKEAEKTDPAKADKTGSESDKDGLAFEGKGYSITAKAGSDAKLPEDTELSAKEVKSDEKDYKAWVDEAEKALKESPRVKDDVSVKSAKFYDITLKSDGKEVEPAADVNVKITYDKALKMSKSGDVYVVHFGVDKNGKLKPEVLKENAVEVKSKAGQKAGTIEVSDIAFDASGFSMYGVLETSTLEDTVVTADGKNYKISVTYDADAKVPEGAKLSVSEIGSDESGYDDYVAKSEDALGMDEGSAGYARLFDIKIVDKDGDKVKIQAPVDVKIELEDMEDKEDKDKTKVVHFADGSDKGDVVEDVKVDGKNISFAAEGFSVYAVVGGVEPASRITVNFYGKDTDTPLATMYVKNEDDLDQVEKILFDPGAGTLDEGEIFRGWVIGDIAHEGATATMPEYTVAMASTEGALKTIEDIRTWAAAFDAESDNHITEGDVVNIRAAIYKIYVVTYLDDKNIAQSADNVLIMPDDTSAFYEYKISQSYTPVKDTVKFNGWEPTDETKGHITSDTQQQDNLYQKDDVIKITGSVDFKVNQSEGHWIVFHENGKGGTYKAPQFVERGQNTEDPGEMTRKGYRFGGWYTEVTGEPDKHGCQQVVESSKFTFGGNLDDYGEGKLHLYAKWTPIETAPYTIIFWGERIGDDGKVVKGEYEVLESFVNNNGRVGQNIPYISRDNGVEDYAYQTGQGAFGSLTDTLPIGQNADEKGIIGHYRGFNLTEASKNQQVEITPEGDAVLNLYYDRVQYNFKFYVYRDGSQNNRYDYANNSASGSDLNGVVSWHSNQTQHPGVTAGSGYELKSETVGNRTYYYFVLPAYYGEDISSDWPTYSKLTGANDRVPVSYVMMVGTHLKPNPSSGGDGTVKGLVSVMNWNILGKTNDADGNYVVIRYPDNFYNWRYHIWYETIPGVDYSGYETHTWNGVTYYKDTVLTVRSSNTTVTNQNAPKYQGFDFIDWRGENWNNRTYWNTTEGNTTLYNINEVYSRQQFTITYFDGNYVDGNGNTIQNRATQKLHESPEIPQGAVIPDEYRNYEPDAQESGYVFVGWYLDEGCTVPYPWGTMPVGSENHSSAIKVYAKWQQIQYRVYLQSNVPANEDFTWGSDTQATCFRVGYGEMVSLPTGRNREGWEFLGWYTTPNFEPSSRFTEDYELTEGNVTTPYDQDTEYTDTYDKWGNLNDPKGNSDKENDRYWITKKLVLYAKWHQKLEGAEGINIVYDPILDAQGVEPPTGHNPPTDDTYYIDTAMATAQAGSIADDPDEYRFECWVLQKWNGTAFEDTDVEVYPGDTFEVLKANAKEEDYTDPDNPKITKKYTVQLRAKYKPVEDPTPTHIDWYKNYEEGGKHEAFHQDPDLQINEPVEIQPAPTRDGYSFIGWARVKTTDSHSHIPEGGTVPVADVLTLGSNDVYIKWEDGKFKAKDKDGDWVEVTEVAADEVTPYHDMYAVWVKDYPITVEKKWENTTGFETHIPETVTVEILKNGESFDPKETITLTKNNDGTWPAVTTTREFPAFDTNGNEIHYTVVETVPDGWDLKSIVYGDDKEFVNQDNYSSAVEVTNTRVNGSITLNKTISGLPDALVSELSGLEFYVKGPNDENYGPYTLSQFTESTESAGTYTFAPEDLAFVKPGEYKFYEDGADILKSRGYELTEAAGTTEDNPVTINLEEAGTASGAITNAYTRVTLPVSVWKTDEDHNTLTGAEFTLYRAEDYDDQTDKPKPGAIPVVERAAVGFDGLLSLGDLLVGEYRLVENLAPAGYNASESAISITVEKTRVTGWQSGYPAEVTQEGDQYWQPGQPDTTWQVRVWNNPGAELPSTGGPGTTWIYLIGSILLLGCGITLIARRRIRSN